MVALAAGIVLIPGAPLGTITTAVQALAGVLLPSATVFLVLLCNDKAVLGPWTNPGWLNAIAAAIVGVLVVLSAILTATTLLPHIDLKLLRPARRWAHRGSPTHARGSRPIRDVAHGAGAREEWTMPPLERPAWSRARSVGMYALRGYLVLAVVMLIVKAIELGVAH